MLVHTDLGYTPRRQSTPQNLWMCSVNYVTQQPYEYICWAASIACITNYIRGTLYTAVEIAQDCLGSNFNQKLGFPAIPELLNEYLDDAAYYTGAENLFDSHIMGNLSQGYPLLGVFYSEWGSHAVTIYRYYSVDYGTIWIMDPLSGTIIIEKDPTTWKYSCVFDSSNETYTLGRVFGGDMD